MIRRLAVAGLVVAAAASASVHVRVGIASDRGRNAVIVDGVNPEEPGLAEALARLLGCPVERSLGGFRCRERKLIDGLHFSGALNYGPLLRLPAMAGATTAVMLPASPRTTVAGLPHRAMSGWWPARAEYSGLPPADSPVTYRLGFSWILLAADMAPLPFLLYWVIRRPEPRWALAAALAMWLLWLGANGTLAIDFFFQSVPSVEGVCLRWISWTPLALLIVAQSRWLGMPLTTGVWVPLGALLLLRPRSAPWMTFSEQMLADVVSLALLMLVAAPMVLRGRNGAPLPESLSIALKRRGSLPSGLDLRLDQPAPPNQIPSRLARIVTIPAAWLERLRGEPLEAAILLGYLRERHSPAAAAFAFSVAVWILLTVPSPRLPWIVALAPLAACAGVTWLEGRWERRIASEALRQGEEPAVLRQALNAIAPEWGGAAAGVASRLPR